ncbi:MAG: GNAT family N-acetyltransferase [Acidimicrobiia bacterium]
MTYAPPRVISGIRYTVCQPDDAPELRRLLAEAFTRHDPPAVAVGLTSDEFEAFLTLFAPAAGVDGLTIIARDETTGAMAGALLTEDAISPPPAGLDGLSGKFDPIFDLLGQLVAKYQAGRTIASGESLHLFLLGVSQQFERRSIGHHLVDTCLANGAARGYRSAITEATNLVSQHIFDRRGFVRRAAVSYADYRHDDLPVFASIADQGGPIAMDRSLSMLA